MIPRLAACVALFLALLAPTAAAQGRVGVPVPDDAPVVASEPGRWKLQAFDDGKRLCLAFAQRRDVGTEAECDRYARLTPVRSALIPQGGGRASWLTGVVAPEVAAVEAEFHDGRRVRADAIAGEAYKGAFAGRVRFAVLETSGRSDEIRIVRSLAADGRVIGAQIGFQSDPVRIAERRIARGGKAKGRWELRTDAYEALVPNPLELDRLELRRCVRVDRAADESDGGRLCVAPGEPDRALRYAWRAGCGAAGSVVGVLAAPGVRNVRAVLGDGSRRVVRLRALPRAYGGRTAGVLTVRRDVAVRRLVAEGAPPLSVGRPPAIAGCDGSALTSDEPFTSPMFVDPTRKGTAVTVRDQGTRLCLALGAVRPFQDCLPPPLDPRDSRFLSRREAGRTVLAGVVPAGVAAVLFRSEAGPVRVEAVDVGYAGRYREHVRFLRATLPGEARLWGPRLLAADGNVISAGSGPDLRYAAAPRTVARGPGGARLVAGAVAISGQAIPCTVLTAGRSAARVSACVPLFPVNAEVQCGVPRRIVIAGLLPRRAHAVEARLASGVVARVRTERVDLGGEYRAFVMVLPRGAVLTSMRVRGVAAGNQPWRLPPAAEQCGYRAFLPWTQSRPANGA